MWRKMIRLDYWHVCLIRRAVSKGCDFTGCHTLCARKPNVWRSGDCTGIGYTKTCSYMFIYCIGMYSWSTKETFGGERYCSNVSLGFHFLRESAEQSFRLQGLCNVCIDIVRLEPQNVQAQTYYQNAPSFLYRPELRVKGRFINCFKMFQDSQTFNCMSW